MRIKRSVTLRKGRPTLGETKTRYGRRVIGVGEDTATALDEHRTYQRGRPPLVFPSRTGRLLEHGNVIRSLDLVVDGANEDEHTLKRIKVHDMRHTFASMAVSSGWDVLRLSRHLGHADPGFILRKYGQLFEQLKKKEAPSLSQLMGEDESP